MSQLIQAIRGMNDILPEQIVYWQHLESVLKDIAERYAYQEIRFPIVESTALFKRAVGEETDIVSKEMYTFNDRNGDSLTLRPEGTAVCMRAGLEQGLFHNQTQRLWYLGPMFRHERPQKGRYRQFYQFGVEAVGFATPDIDVELLAMTARFWAELGLSDKVSLELNSLGSAAARVAYRAILVEYFTQHENELDEDSKRRLHTNPLRILDSKNPELKALIAAAPKITEHLDPESKMHFDYILKGLDQLGIAYNINPALVRGLDYYSRTVFEWVAHDAGAQATVCAGGRYDDLLQLLSGKSIPAVGFALGLERVIAMLEQQIQDLNFGPDLYIVSSGLQAAELAMSLAEELRNALPHWQIQMNCGEASFKNQLKKADKSGAKFALIVGEEEISQGTAQVKQLRTGEQTTLARANLIDYLIEHS